MGTFDDNNTPNDIGPIFLLILVGWLIMVLVLVWSPIMLSAFFRSLVFCPGLGQYVNCLLHNILRHCTVHYSTSNWGGSRIHENCEVQLEVQWIGHWSPNGPFSEGLRIYLQTEESTGCFKIDWKSSISLRAGFVSCNVQSFQNMWACYFYLHLPSSSFSKALKCKLKYDGAKLNLLILFNIVKCRLIIIWVKIIK